MKKYVLIFSIISLFLVHVKADDDNPPSGVGWVSGNVIDALSNEPMPYVNVVVRNSSDSILTGGITDHKGNFEIKAIPEGNNTIEIQFIGYEKITRDIDISRAKSRHHLSTISLNESSQQLDEVVVRAELSSVTQKIDRKVINVGKDLTATGTTASEMLNNVQSISVDSQTGAISLRGNENVKILVDGRPTNISAAQLLKQIPSSSIKSVELITNPSAKYSPEGMSGMINIVLYKNATLGLNGSLNGGIQYSRNLKYNGALDINYRKGKLNVYGNYGANSGTSNNFGEITRLDNASYSKFNRDDSNASHLVKLGADLYINDANTFSIYTTQNLYNGETNATTLIYFEDVLNSDNPYVQMKDNYSSTYNAYFSHGFKKEGHLIELEASYSPSDQQEDARYDQLMDPADLTLNYSDDIRNNVNSTLINLDYTNPISEDTKIELGLEARMRDANNNQITDQHQFVYDENFLRLPDGNGWFETLPLGNSSFMYDRRIYSAYANYNQKINKFMLQLGVRAEQYDVEADFSQGDETGKYNDNILSLYPSAFFTYSASDKDQFQLSYSRRVDRPGIEQVNPIRTWSTPLLTRVGNPELRPQFTNSYELNYTRRVKKGSLSFGTFYRVINDNITFYADIDEFDENKVVLTNVNSESQDRFGVEFSGMYRFTGWWSTNASFDLYSQTVTGYSFGKYVEVDSRATNFRVNNTFKATERLSFQLFGMYRGRSESIQWSRLPMWMVNSGASIKVLRAKGTINLRINDIFGAMRFAFESNANIFPTHGNFNWESRSAYVGFMYNFGRGDFKAKKRRTRDNNEFQGSGGF